MSKRTLLAVFAHPDDESFGTGGSLALCAAQGIRVVLVCATRCEVGEISDSRLAKPDNLGEVREAEMRCAAQALGISEVVFLGYRDSGMEGTMDNTHPEALAQASAKEVKGRLVRIIRRVQPQVLVTFDPNGGYGHPDHVAIHRHTVDAFHASADQGMLSGQEPSWQPERLLYSVFPRSLFLDMRSRLEALGVDTSDFAQFEEGGLGWPDDELHVSVDVSSTFDAKQKALRCHQTQFGPNNPLRQLPEEVTRRMMSREHFALAWPHPPVGSPMSDLFDGL